MKWRVCAGVCALFFLSGSSEDSVNQSMDCSASSTPVEAETWDLLTLLKYSGGRLPSTFTQVLFFKVVMWKEQGSRVVF